jgi:hypothetical protein
MKQRARRHASGAWGPLSSSRASALLKLLRARGYRLYGLSVVYSTCWANRLAALSIAPAIMGDATARRLQLATSTCALQFLGPLLPPTTPLSREATRSSRRFASSCFPCQFQMTHAPARLGCVQSLFSPHPATPQPFRLPHPIHAGHSDVSYLEFSLFVQQSEQASVTRRNRCKPRV